jgi:thioredoxin reductase (NADPH)
LDTVTDEFDVVVAGAGIAGLTAGLSSARLGSSTLLLTGGVPGGLLLSIDRIDGVPGFPDGVPGYELCPLAQEQASAAGAEFSMAELKAFEAGESGLQVVTSEGEIGAKALILATGARFRELGVPGEERLRGSGVSHCASCDAPLLRERVAVVVGGGDSALQEALTLAESLAAVIVLQREDELSAQETYRRAAFEHPRIEIRTGTLVEEILGDEKVAGIRIRTVATDAAEDIKADAVFAYVGLTPNTPFANGAFELDGEGRIPTDPSMQSAVPGVFAAGIVRRGAAGRAAGSAGDGATAAIAAHRYLNDGHWHARNEGPVPVAVADGVMNG